MSAVPGNGVHTDRQRSGKERRVLELLLPHLHGEVWFPGCQCGTAKLCVHCFAGLSGTTARFAPPVRIPSVGAPVSGCRNPGGRRE